MNYKHLISLICMVMSFLSCQSQTNKTDRTQKQVTCKDCNLKDIHGGKSGLWIENNGLIEVYYKNNQRDGIFKAYNRKNGKLAGLGEYRDGAKKGKWYYFDESGHLLFIEENVKVNTEYTRLRDDGVTVTPKFTSYVKSYYPNGMVKEEGQVLYDEDIEIDYYKTGTWKYYDEVGKLTETKE